MSQKTVSNPTVWYRNYYGNLVKLVNYFVKIEIVMSTLQDFWWYLWRLEVIFVRYLVWCVKPSQSKEPVPIHVCSESVRTDAWGLQWRKIGFFIMNGSTQEIRKAKAAQKP